MDSYQVLEKAVDAVGAKKVAADLNVSLSLVYKWCQKPRDTADPASSGARNPLDRLAGLMASTADDGPLEWLCASRKGYFVHNPTLEDDGEALCYVSRTQQMIQEFSDVLLAMTNSMADDNRVDSEESKHIRAEWEKLKQVGEEFVTACERGVFDHERELETES